MPEKLSELSQVLSDCCQQHFIPDATQASQPQPVEPEDAFHMRKPHLDLLALAARLLEGLRMSQRSNAIATSSLRSRVILGTIAVVHLGFNEQPEGQLPAAAADPRRKALKHD